MITRTSFEKMVFDKTKFEALYLLIMSPYYVDSLQVTGIENIFGWKESMTKVVLWVECTTSNSSKGKGTLQLTLD